MLWKFCLCVTVVPHSNRFIHHLGHTIQRIHCSTFNYVHVVKKCRVARNIAHVKYRLTHGNKIQLSFWAFFEVSCVWNWRDMGYAVSDSLSALLARQVRQLILTGFLDSTRGWDRPLIRSLRLAVYRIIFTVFVCGKGALWCNYVTLLNLNGLLDSIFIYSEHQDMFRSYWDIIILIYHVVPSPKVVRRTRQ